MGANMMCALFLSVVCANLCAPSSLSQSATSPSVQAPPMVSFTTDWPSAQNRWRLSAPKQSVESDTVDSTERSARNAFLSRRLRLAAQSGNGEPIVDYDF